jgi:hypothetical protein
LVAILQAEKADDETREQAIAAAGMVKAADLLAIEYTLVITNVPFLSRGKQSDLLKKHIEDHYKEAKQDLATAFLDRLLMLCARNGGVALVTPQNWHFLTSYGNFRRILLKTRHWHTIARLGPAAFQNMNWWAATTQLSILSEETPPHTAWFCDVDASKTRITDEKPFHLKHNPVTVTTQADQLANPDARIAPELGATASFLRDRADSLQGLATADYSRFGCCFWEVSAPSSKWTFQQSTVLQNCMYGGKEHALRWEEGRGELAKNPLARIQGLAALGKQGVAVSQMNRLCATLYMGELFDNNTAVIIPTEVADLSAIWAYCSSPDFYEEVRKIDKSTAVTNATLVKVPFDLAHWQKVAAEKYPNGLPEPESDDPTQ